MMKSERQLIDVAEAKGYVETFMADPILKMAANAVLNNTPRVDAVEVVRCKDCTRRKKGYCTIRKDSWGATLLVGDHDFCSDAERREEV